MSKIFTAIGTGIFWIVSSPGLIVGGVLSSPFSFIAHHIENMEKANVGIIGFDNQHYAEKYIKNNKYTPLVLQYSNKKLSDLDFNKSDIRESPGFNKFQFSKVLRQLNFHDKNEYKGYSYDEHMNILNEYIKNEDNLDEYLNLHENMATENKKINDGNFTKLELAKLIEHQKYCIKDNFFHQPYHYSTLKFIKHNQYKTHYEEDK